MYLWPKHVRGRYSTRLTGPKPPTADPHGWRAGARPLVQGPPRGWGERRRSHAASARARVAVPALAAELLLRHHQDAYQCVRTCPGARGWGEAWVAGAEPSSCTEMAPHVVVVCSTYQPRPAAGDSWAASSPVATRRPRLPPFPEWPQWSACCLLDLSHSCPVSTPHVHHSSPMCNRVLTRTVQVPSRL